jgi:hypothetical protein
MSDSKEIEIKNEMTVGINSYQEMFNTLKITYLKLKDKHGSIPEKFIGREKDDWEDHILLAANAKHLTIELWRDSSGSFESISADIDYFEANIVIHIADAFLTEHGFDRSTDKLRESFVKTNPLMRDLLKLQGQLKALSSASEKLVKAFENDETNCRRLLERQTKYNGL